MFALPIISNGTSPLAHWIQLHRSANGGIGKLVSIGPIVSGSVLSKSSRKSFPVNEIRCVILLSRLAHILDQDHNRFVFEIPRYSERNADPQARICRSLCVHDFTLSLSKPLISLLIS